MVGKKLKPAAVESLLTRLLPIRAKFDVAEEFTWLGIDLHGQSLGYEFDSLRYLLTGSAEVLLGKPLRGKIPVIIRNVALTSRVGPYRISLAPRASLKGSFNIATGKGAIGGVIRLFDRREHWKKDFRVSAPVSFDPKTLQIHIGTTVTSGLPGYIGSPAISIVVLLLCGCVSGPPPPPVAPPRCTTTAFRVPNSRTGCRQRRAGRFRKGFEGFRMNATFRNAPPGEICRACEYRQEVRGTFTVNGAPSDHDLVEGPLSAAVFQEDCVWVDVDILDVAGAVIRSEPRAWCYGHRETIVTVPAGDTYGADRRTGCAYSGADEPGVTDVPGTTYAFDLEFRGRIIDILNRGVVREENTWRVTCSGTL